MSASTSSRGRPRVPRAISCALRSHGAGVLEGELAEDVIQELFFVDRCEYRYGPAVWNKRRTTCPVHLVDHRCRRGSPARVSRLPSSPCLHVPTSVVHRSFERAMACPLLRRGPRLREVFVAANSVLRAGGDPGLSPGGLIAIR